MTNESKRFTKSKDKWYTSEELGVNFITDNTDKEEEEEIIMTQLLERMKHYNVPPSIAKELGLEKDWKENLSPDFLKQVLQSVDQYKNVLKKLSDK